MRTLSSKAAKPLKPATSDREQAKGEARRDERRKGGIGRGEKWKNPPKLTKKEQTEQVITPCVSSHQMLLAQATGRQATGKKEKARRTRREKGRRTCRRGETAKTRKEENTKDARIPCVPRYQSLL